MTTIHSWGRLTRDEHNVLFPADSESVSELLAGSSPGIAYGMGRSYGDVCLNPGGTLWHTRLLDHFIAFDPATGILRCESGVSLKAIQQLFIPRGWALPVTPGTWFVTVGGAIANDVHGKNHHVAGSFGDHLVSLTIIRSDGERIVCSSDDNSPWFHATVGGLGLTGLITEATIKLKPVSSACVEVEKIGFSGIDEFMQLSIESESQYEYIVSWLDAVSAKQPRGIFMRGNDTPATACGGKARNLGMPVAPPFSLVNHYTIKTFNQLYFNLNKGRNKPHLEHYRTFFYPLDHIHYWNRIYGPKGFFQHQCVIPRESGADVLKDLIQTIDDADQGSFLSVLKIFGNRRSVGMLGFPRPGITLAMDFPNKGESTRRVLKRLDDIVAAAGGAIYMAKDATMSRSLFESGYPGLEEFARFRDPGMQSALLLRLL